MAGDRADGLMNRTTASELYRQKLDRYGGASPFQPLASQVWTPMATYMDLNPHLWAKIGRETDCCDIAPQRSAVSWYPNCLRSERMFALGQNAMLKTVFQ
jgi:hypothetical protein